MCFRLCLCEYKVNKCLVFFLSFDILILSLFVRVYAIIEVILLSCVHFLIRMSVCMYVCIVRVLVVCLCVFVSFVKNEDGSPSSTLLFAQILQQKDELRLYKKR